MNWPSMWSSIGSLLSARFDANQVPRVFPKAIWKCYIVMPRKLWPAPWRQERRRFCWSWWRVFSLEVAYGEIKHDGIYRVLRFIQPTCQGGSIELWSIRRLGELLKICAIRSTRLRE